MRDSGGAQRVLQRHLRSVLVEVRDLLGQFVDMLVGQFAAALDCRQQVVLRELAHLQQVFDCSPSPPIRGASSLPVIGRTSR